MFGNAGFDREMDFYALSRTVVRDWVAGALESFVHGHFGAPFALIPEYLPPLGIVCPLFYSYGS